MGTQELPPLAHGAGGDARDGTLDGQPGAVRVRPALGGADRPDRYQRLGRLAGSGGAGGEGPVARDDARPTFDRGLIARGFDRAGACGADRRSGDGWIRALADHDSRRLALPRAGEPSAAWSPGDDRDLRDLLAAARHDEPLGPLGDPLRRSRARNPRAERLDQLCGGRRTSGSGRNPFCSSGWKL